MPETTTDSFMPLPRWKCHKEVYADKIESVVVMAAHHMEEYALILEGGGRVRVDAEYMKKHAPKKGGYYVVYDDGYKSFSPAEPFESGYTLTK